MVAVEQKDGRRISDPDHEFDAHPYFRCLDCGQQTNLGIRSFLEVMYWKYMSIR